MGWTGSFRRADRRIKGNAHNIAWPLEPLPTGTHTVKALPKRQVSRGFNRNRKTLDVIQVRTRKGLEEIVVPALPHTLYWAILRCMYERSDKRVSADELCDAVGEFLSDTDPTKWSWYVERPSYNGRNHWRTRLVLNARNLCRISGKAAYGRRLTSIGHILRFETGRDGPFFTLHTTLTVNNTAPQKRGRRIGWSRSAWRVR